MKSARITGPNEPLKVIEIQTPHPKDNQVLVKVKAVGVCHSDLHLWEGGYDLGDGKFMKVTDIGVKYPVTPGHEIVGTVEAFGDNVKGFSKDDQVLVYPWIGCGECPACKVGNENLCDTPKSITQSKIICVDLDDQKLEIAKEMGADFVMNSKDPETPQKIISICNGKGADSVVDFVNAPPTAKMGLAVLRKRGNLVLVGLFGGSMELCLVPIPLKSLLIQGAYTGNYSDMVELLDLARKGTINPMISKRYSLDGANSALEDLKARKIVGRAVINP